MVDYYSPLINSTARATSSDLYFPVFNGALAGGQAIESNTQSTLYSSYDAEGLFILASTNGDPNNVPVTLRIGGVNTALTTTLPASTTGLYQDNTNSVAVTTGDLLSVFLDRGNTNTTTVQAIGLWLKSAQPVNKISCLQFTLSTANVTRYFQVPGDGILATTEDSRHRVILPVACMIENFYCRVNTNGRTSDTTITLRKNGADTAAVLTIPASTTGFIEDTTTQISYAAGDDYSVKLVTGAGSGSFTPVFVGMDIVNDDVGSFTQILAGQAAFASTATVHRGVALGGRIGVTSGLSAANSQIPMRGDSTLRKFRVNTFLNTSTISTTVDLEVNGALAGLSLTIPPSTTGTISDLSTEIDITDGDLVNLYGLSSAGTGTKIVGWISYEIDQDVTPPPSSAGLNSLMFWY